MSQKKYPSHPDRKPLGSIQVPGFTSIRIEPGQRYTVYPPKPGTNNFCVEPCAHFGCLRARFDANQNCPECHQLIGYGGAVPVCVPNVTTTEGLMIYSHNSILLIHANCYDQLVAKAFQARIQGFIDAGQPVPELEGNTLNDDFLQELQDNPTGLFAKLYLDFRDTPNGIDNSDPRLAVWVMEHTYPGNAVGGAPAPKEGEPEETEQPSEPEKPTQELKPVPEEVIEALLTVREHGTCNMLDFNCVLSAMYEFAGDSAEWLAAHEFEYMDALNTMGERVTSEPKEPPKRNRKPRKVKELA